MTQNLILFSFFNFFSYLSFFYTFFILFSLPFLLLSSFSLHGSTRDRRVPDWVFKTGVLADTLDTFLDTAMIKTFGICQKMWMFGRNIGCDGPD
jgi:hypothetical protein